MVALGSVVSLWWSQATHPMAARWFRREEGQHPISQSSLMTWHSSRKPYLVPPLRRFTILGAQPLTHGPFGTSQVQTLAYVLQEELYMGQKGKYHLVLPPTPTQVLIQRKKLAHTFLVCMDGLF